jgi:predicted DNA-binding transcriptional regulator AlpA
MPALTTQTPLLTPDEAAAWLRSSERTLERWRGEGAGPRFVRLGRRVVYRLADLETWIDRQTQRPSNPSSGA